MQVRLQRTAELQRAGGQAEASHHVAHRPTPGDIGRASQIDSESAKGPEGTAQATRDVRCRRLLSQLARGGERPSIPGCKVDPVGKLVAGDCALARGTDR